MGKVKTRAFVTKYALTKGIIEVDGYETDHESFYVGGWQGSFFKNEYYFTMDEAIKNAEERRTRKIKSLEMQIEKLEKMTFTC